LLGVDVICDKLYSLIVRFKACCVKLIDGFDYRPSTHSPHAAKVLNVPENIDNI